MPPHCRLRAHEAVLRRKHEAALDNLQSAAGHCENAGGAQNLNAVADFIRSEISDHFRLHDPDEGQASWLSRGAAGALMLGKHAVKVHCSYFYLESPRCISLCHRAEARVWGVCRHRRGQIDT